jgi:cobalt transporter subunit CbtA
MKLFQRLFFAAVLAGLIAGLAMTALQQWRVAPLILAAEVYETAEPTHAHDHASAEQGATAETSGHVHDDSAWAPSDGIERTAYTILADLLAAAGFALLLGAVSVLSGIEITTRNGVLWGLGGFLAFQLAPAFGLPPELPGMPAADLVARQVWWVSTALATAAGLLVIAKYRNWTAIGAGAVLLLLPHIIGAPGLVAEQEGAVPARLATEFAASTLTVGAVFWLTVGPLLGWFSTRFATSNSPAFKGAHA